MMFLLNISAFLLMTLLGALGSLFFKLSSGSTGLNGLLRDVRIYLGGVFYFLSLVITVYLLSVWDYSVVLPLTAVTYIWTLILGKIVLHENISRKQIIGVGFILVGSIFIAL